MRSTLYWRISVWTIGEFLKSAKIASGNLPEVALELRRSSGRWLVHLIMLHLLVTVRHTSCMLALCCMMMSCRRTKVIFHISWIMLIYSCIPNGWHLLVMYGPLWSPWQDIPTSKIRNTLEVPMRSKRQGHDRTPAAMVLLNHCLLTLFFSKEGEFHALANDIGSGCHTNFNYSYAYHILHSTACVCLTVHWIASFGASMSGSIDCHRIPLCKHQTSGTSELWYAFWVRTFWVRKYSIKKSCSTVMKMNLKI